MYIVKAIFFILFNFYSPNKPFINANISGGGVFLNNIYPQIFAFQRYELKRNESKLFL